MSLAGFDHVFASAVEMHLAEGLRIRVVPAVVTVLLKIIAYMEDPHRRSKDLQDIRVVLARYEAHSDRLFSDAVFDADHKILTDLRKQRDRLDDAIVAIEKFARTQAPRRGRPPKWLAAKMSNSLKKHVSEAMSSGLVSVGCVRLVTVAVPDSAPIAPREPGELRHPRRIGSIVLHARGETMSLYTVSVSAKRKSGVYEDTGFAWSVRAEIDPPSSLEVGDFIKGRFVDLTTERLQALPGMKEVSLQIEGQRAIGSCHWARMERLRG
jgi:hypothetical protein